jgi:hypothetical protein
MLGYFIYLLGFPKSVKNKIVKKGVTLTSCDAEYAKNI